MVQCVRFSGETELAPPDKTQGLPGGRECLSKRQAPPTILRNPAFIIYKLFMKVKSSLSLFWREPVRFYFPLFAVIISGPEKGV